MDWNIILNLAKEINIAQLIAIALIFWFFYSKLDKKIEKVEKKLEKIEERITKLEHDIIEIKTVLRLKECCMIQDERKLPKAE